MKTTVFREVLKIDIESIINEFVQLIKDQNPLFKDKVLAIPITFDASRYFNSKDTKSVSMSFTLLYHSPHNYTKVCWANANPFDLSQSHIQSETVNFVTDHDSCWRDGTSRTIRDFAEKFENLVEVTFKKRELDANKVHIDVRIGFSGIRFIDGYLGLSKQDCIETGKSVLVKTKTV